MVYKKDGKSNNSVFDVGIVGGGLSGLLAGIYCQQKGLSTVIIDRRDVLGGLCGTFWSEGYEFVIGCNDFGSSVRTWFEQLGVDCDFLNPKTRFFYDDGIVTLPPDAKTIISLLGFLPDIFRIFYSLNIKKMPIKSLAELVDQCVKNPKFAQIILTLACPLALTPDKVYLSLIKNNFSKKYNYGYDKPVIPRGGPGEMAKQLEKRFVGLGGEVILGESCQVLPAGSRVNTPISVIRTDKQDYHCGDIISSMGRYDEYPEQFSPGLSLCTFHLAVKKELVYPEGFHTLVHVPSGIATWMGELNNGQFPKEFTFNIFCSDLPEKKNYYTINIYFLSPRNCDELTPIQKAEITDYIFNKAERIIPGLKKHVIYQLMLDPKGFKDRHGLSSRVAPFILPEDFIKPGHCDSSGIYHIGNTVYPPGEHAGGAMLSGLTVAKEVVDRWPNKVKTQIRKVS